MTTLRWHLAAWDYSRRYRSTILGPGEPGPFSRAPAAAAGRLDAAEPDEAALLRLLALGEPVAAEQLPSWAADLLHALARAGLAARRDDGRWQTDGWVAVPFGTACLLTDRPRLYGGEEVRVYLGPDSLMLAGALPQVAGLRVLDLGAGCGIQGLLGVPAPSEVVLVDIEPRAVRFCALNAELCGRADSVLCYRGDMYGPVRGERFDLIVSLPPYVPVPDGVPYSGVANGGRDGLTLVRSLLRGAENHLRPGGRLVALCQLLARPEGPLLARELGWVAPRLHCDFEVFARSPLANLRAELADGLASRVPGWTREMLAEAYDREFRRLGVTEVFSVILRAELR
jgi:SAM-dependent methyltransferase